MPVLTSEPPADIPTTSEPLAVTFFRHPYDAERGAFIRTGVGRPEHACHVGDLYLLMGR